MLTDTEIIHKTLGTLTSINKDTITFNTVYHYTSPEGMMGILDPSTPKLYFSQYDSLNDYKERLDITEYISGYCDYQVKRGVMPAEFAENIKNIVPSNAHQITLRGKENLMLDSGEIIEDITEAKTLECYTYICSFSTEPDLLPMWRMYSKSEHYEGYCLGMVNSIFRSDTCFEKGYNIELREVIYDNKKKNEILNNLLLPICQEYNSITSEEKKTLLYMVGEFIYHNQYTFKNQAFDYEKEIRAILHIPKDAAAFDNISERKYRQSNGLIVPYVEYSLNKEMIYSVNLAPSIKEDIAKSNLTDLLLSRGYNVCINKSNIPIRNC